ncbi:ABC transporter substrate-binding protein [Brevibacterium sp. 50QC2O2]|uniref:ABC transporter substrate-binding protein n=1 Tax=Brevibacterium sp. 50QC2O2 TaxID=2968459 RepID=UPI00211BB5FC|nr:ABC transporter substrate-binding protein [Brevibacterium sp. 50QC2O2]MCQ9388145.1 ABC transporter substrate-binding protein [Brevibacterium sp. 50QC2O2]
MARKQLALAVLAAASAATLALTGCTTGGGGSASGDKTDTIRTVTVADPNTFDPADFSGVSAYQTGALLYGTLVYQDQNNTLAPGIASEFKVDDPKHQEYTIRDGLKCGDGTEITPTVVKNSLEYFVKNSQQKELVFGPSAPTITADDASKKVTVDLDTGWAGTGRGLTMNETGIICPAGLEDPKGMAQGTVEGAFSGPYTIAENKPGASISFTLREDGYAFPEYKEKPDGEPAKKINFAINSDQNAIANGLLTGTYDVSNVSGDAMDRFKGKDEFGSEKYMYTSLYLMFNERKGNMMVDQSLRKAIAQAMNRTTFNQTAGGGQGKVLDSFATEDVECFAGGTDAIIKQDEAAAKKVLAGKTIRMIGTLGIGPNGAGNSYVAQALEAAGAKVKLRNLDNTTWATETGKDTWDLTVMSSLNPSRTMAGGLNYFAGLPKDQGGRNLSGAEHKELVDLNLKAMAETDKDARCGIYKQVQEVANREAYVVPMAANMSQVTTRAGFAAPLVNGSAPTIAMYIKN